MIKKRIFVGVLLFAGVMLLTMRAEAFEKVGTTSLQYLKVNTDARSTGMGDAYTAFADEVSGIMWNPAAIARISKVGVAASYVDYFIDTDISSFAVALSLGNFGNIGVHGIRANYGEMEVTSVDLLGYQGDTYVPGRTGEFINPGGTTFGLTYSRPLTNRFSFGLTAKYVSEDLIRADASAIAFDLGARFRTEFRSLVVALSVKNFGEEVKFLEESYPLPQTFNVGIAGYLIGTDQEGFLFNTSNMGLAFAVDLQHPRDYDQQMNFGLEYSLFNTLYGRVGYKFNYDAEGLAGGFGIRTLGFSADYSISDYGEFLDTVHRFSLGFSI